MTLGLASASRWRSCLNHQAAVLSDRQGIRDHYRRAGAGLEGEVQGFTEVPRAERC